jgi:hypothetical protein
MNERLEIHEQTNPFATMVPRSDPRRSHMSPERVPADRVTTQAGLDTEIIVSAFIQRNPFCRF